MNLKKMPVNRKLIAWFFTITGLLSLGLWWKGRVPDSGGWWRPLKITYEIEKKELKGNRDISRETAKLVGQVSDWLGGQKGKYGFYVYRLGEEVGYGGNEDEMMPGASIMKIPIMATVLNKIDGGQLTYENIYILKDTDKESGSGPIEFMGAGTKLSVRNLLEQMGKKSDNTAARVLADIAGRGDIREEMKNLGMKGADFDNNVLSAYEVAMMWKNLWNKYPTALDSFLKESIYEERIPKGLPEGVEIVHKVGTGDGVWADSGVVAGKFVLVILNKDIDIDEAKKTVPELTKMLWDFENSRSTGQ